ncbi:MAG: hypothetical protein ACREEP_07855 [Dongiaceae bacterium]
MHMIHLRRLGLLSLIGLLTGLSAGCQNTLFYGEKTAFSMAIHLNDNPQTPVEVNMGLKRQVGEVAPPVATQEEEGKDVAVGESVSSLSGFRLRYEENPTNVLLGDLYIRTQFATGIAATILAGDPAQAIQVIKADFDRSEAFLAEDAQARVDKIVTGIGGLDDASALALACNPPVTHSTMAALVAARDPSCQRRSDPVAARQVLSMQATMDDRSEENLAAWEQALHLQ